MAYIDVIPLATAKTHLRVDSTLTDDDAAITRMIETALSYIEEYTRVYVYQRSKTFLAVDGCVIVYDYPRGAVTDPADYDTDDTVQMTYYDTFNYGSETVDITMSVGHLDPADVPKALIDVALEMIDLMYYEHETGKHYLRDLSAFSREVLDSHKRFII